MALTVGSVVEAARVQLRDVSGTAFTDDELARYCLAGIRDIWRSITTIREDYFTAVATATVTTTLDQTPTPASGEWAFLSGAFKILTIEPVDDLSNYVFVPEPYNSDTSAAARRALLDRTAGTIYFAVTGVGPGAGAPTISFFPTPSSDIQVRIAYTQSLEGFLGESEAGTEGSTVSISSYVNGDEWRTLSDASGLFAAPAAGEAQIRIGNSITPTFRWADLQSASPPPARAGTPAGGSNVGLRLAFADSSGPKEILLTLARTREVLAAGADLASVTELGIDSAVQSPAYPSQGRIDLSMEIALPAYPEQALMSYVVAYARARDRDDHAPDTTWAALYRTEKDNILAALAGRDEVGPRAVDISVAFGPLATY